MFKCLLFLCLFHLILSVKYDNELPRFLQHRSGSHYFVRLNSKLSIFNYTTIFEYAAGYRINWDVKPFEEIRSHPERRLALHRSIESELEKYGLDGHACLSRFFCEMDTISGYDDLITRILKIFFRRSYDVYTCPAEPACPVSLAWIPYLLYKDIDNAT